MWITEAVRRLGDYDVSDLSKISAELEEEEWHRDDSLRQNLTRNRQAESVYLLSIEEEAFKEILSQRPLRESDISKHAGWDLLIEHVAPAVEQALSYYPTGGIVTRVQLARMRPGTVIKPHIDHSTMLISAHRIHLPITTCPDVEFVIDGERRSLESGVFFELNNRRQHSVVNRGNTNRIHLIVDYLPPENNSPHTLSPGYEKRHKQKILKLKSPRVEFDKNITLPKIIATSVVRGAHKNESHGGLYLVDMESGSSELKIDWNTCDISWEGRGWDRGLRGIALYKNHSYVAASDELFCYDSEFNIIDSFRSPYLKHCHEIFCYNDYLLLTSTGFDSILRFSLIEKQFDKGWTIRPGDRKNLNLKPFDPIAGSGPKPGNTIHINSVFEDNDGIYVGARALPFLLRFNAREFGPVIALPKGTHNARPYRGGVLYNDTNADLVAWENGNTFCYLEVPRYPEEDLVHTEHSDERLARQAFGRGLCLFDNEILITGSSPSTITAYHLPTRDIIRSVNITMDVRNAIHGLEIWPDGSVK